MRNTFLNNLKKNRHKVSIDDEIQSVSHVLIERNFCHETPLLEQEINSMISRFPETDQKIIGMVSKGFKYKEIADELELPLGTIKNRLHNLRKELKNALNIHNQKI